MIFRDTTLRSGRNNAKKIFDYCTRKRCDPEFGFGYKLSFVDQEDKTGRITAKNSIL